MRGAMVGVVFGAEYVGIHFHAAIESQLFYPVLKGPGSTVKALHHSSEGYVGIVPYQADRKFLSFRISCRKVWTA